MAEHDAAAPKKRPAFQFYPADWRKDVELRACSVAARGLWIDLMCVAHECEPYGHLMLNGAPMTAAQLVGQIGVPEAQIKRLLAELMANGVARRTPDGAIYSKRMVEDERIRNARAAGGPAGAEHGVKGAEAGKKGGRPPNRRGDKKPPLEPPPSSSSSSSASASPPAEEKERAKRAPHFDAAGIALPDWLDRGLWAEWVADRAERRKPITERAAGQQIATLAEFRAAGHPPERVIRHAMASGNQGLYPPPRVNGHHAPAETPFQRSQRERVAEMTGGLVSRKPPQQTELEAIDALPVATRVG